MIAPKGRQSVVHGVSRGDGGSIPLSHSFRILSAPAGATEHSALPDGPAFALCRPCRGSESSKGEEIVGVRRPPTADAVGYTLPPLRGSPPGLGLRRTWPGR